MKDGNIGGFPLRSWRIVNFKSVESADIALSPLTVLVGANSSGKSSLIHSMLLIVQSAQSYSNEPAIPLNGPRVELGDFRDVRFADAASRDKVVIGGTLSMAAHPASALDPPDGAGGRPVTQPARFDWETRLLNSRKNDDPGRAHIRGIRFEARLPDGQLEGLGQCEIAVEAETLGRKPLEIRERRPHTRPHAVLRLEGTLRVTDADGKSINVRTAGLTHRAGIPVSAYVPRDSNVITALGWVQRVRHVFRDRRKNPRTEWDRIRDRRRDGVPSSGSTAEDRLNELATASCDRLIELIVQFVDPETRDTHEHSHDADGLVESFESARLEAVKRGFWSQLNLLVNDRKFQRAVTRRLSRGDQVLVPARDDDNTLAVATGLEVCGSAVESFFMNRVVHLGPLRQDPQVLHLSVPTGGRGFVGRKGEFTVALLHKFADRVVLCPLRDGANQHLPLRDAVNYWLGEFGLADSIDTVYRPRLGLEPRIKVDDVARPLDMTAVGVGVSQLLPVLVSGLYSEPGSVLLFEQPELHLHPAMQQTLADFLAACAWTGRQVIVETHSDHFLTRLRRRIAEDEHDEMVDLVGIIFTERVDGRTRFRPIDTNRFGGVEEWPEGFFDQGPRDAQKLLRAGLRKKKREAG